MPPHRQRATAHESRVAGLAITLSAAALILVVVYVVGGYANKILVEVVAIPMPSVSAAP